MSCLMMLVFVLVLLHVSMQRIEKKKMKKVRKRAKETR